MKRRASLSRRTSIANTGAPIRRTGIKARRTPMSSAELLARLLVTIRATDEHGVVRCEIRLPGICEGRAVDWCHRIARGRGGKWTPSNGLAGCRPCHEATTNTRGQRAEFERLGYIVRTGEDTTLAPVFIGSVRYLLTDDGRRLPTDVEHSEIAIGEAA